MPKAGCKYEFATKSTTSTMARNKVVLPEPLAPMRTMTAGRRTWGLEALARKQGKLGVVPGMRKSCFTSSRMDRKLLTENE